MTGISSPITERLFDPYQPKLLTATGDRAATVLQRALKHDVVQISGHALRDTALDFVRDDAGQHPRIEPSYAPSALARHGGFENDPAGGGRDWNGAVGDRDV